MASLDGQWQVVASTRPSAGIRIVAKAYSPQPYQQIASLSLLAIASHQYSSKPTSFPRKTSLISLLGAPLTTYQMKDSVSTPSARDRFHFKHPRRACPEVDFRNRWRAHCHELEIWSLWRSGPGIEGLVEHGGGRRGKLLPPIFAPHDQPLAVSLSS